MLTPNSLRTIALFTLLATPPLTQAAQSAWPDKPIRLVLGSAAGSGPDIISRLMADRLYGAWGQRVIVDPRPGVAGLMSADIVTRSAADGYTWMMLTSQLLVATKVYSNHKVNLEKDFASISLLGSVPFVLVVNAQLPAKSVGATTMWNRSGRRISNLPRWVRRSPRAWIRCSTAPSAHSCGLRVPPLFPTPN